MNTDCEFCSYSTEDWIKAVPVEPPNFLTY